MERAQGRKPNELRVWKMTTGVLEHAEGSAFIESGKTQVMCAASVDNRVPPFLRNEDSGWVTAEYSMLPRSTHTRSARERGGRIGGRTMEIQRMIGRSLRSVIDLKRLGERTITVDCDVIQADGGTRVASITAAWVALYQACALLADGDAIPANPITDSVAAVSVGVIGKEICLDLDYSEDYAADVDMNVVMTGSGRLVEVQATAEGKPFSVSRMNSLIRLAGEGIKHIKRLQHEAVSNSGETRHSGGLFRT